MADYPLSSCDFCSSPAYWKVVDGQYDAEGYPAPSLLCHGHGGSNAYCHLELEELPKMVAAECHSGDTWVTCEKHRSSYSLFARRLRTVRTAVGCETCSVEAEAV